MQREDHELRAVFANAARHGLAVLSVALGCFLVLMAVVSV